METNVQVCQSCGASIGGADEICPACGAKTAVAVRREEAERELSARLATVPEHLAVRIRTLMARHEDNPQSVATCIQLSGAFNDAGMKDLAIRWMESAIALDPTNKFLDQKLRLLVGGADLSGDAREVERAAASTKSTARLVGIALAAVVVVAIGVFAYRAIFPSIRKVAGFDKEDALTPKFAPDGRAIAYVRAPKFTVFGIVDAMAGHDTGETVLEVVTTGESPRRVVSSNDGVFLDYEWVPGTDELSYVAYDRETTRPVLRRVKPGGEGAAIANTIDFAWSPDGRRVAYVAHYDWDGPGAIHPGQQAGALYVADADGTSPRQVVDLHCSHPSWSRDGRMIAFHAEPRWDAVAARADLGGDRDGVWDLYVGDIYVHHLESGETKKLTTGGKAQRAVFTPDTNRVAYLAYAGDTESFDNELRVVGIDGTDDRVLLAKGAEYEGFRSFAFHPGGEWLVFEGVFVNPNKPRAASTPSPLGLIGGQTNYVSDLFAVRLDGTGLHRLPKRRFEYRRGPSFSPDGRKLAFEVEFLEMRREAWVMTWKD